MNSGTSERDWELIRVRENLSPRTIERFRRGALVRASSLARIIRAVEALGLQHLLRERATTDAAR
jgi:hypothetical protein